MTRRPDGLHTHELYSDDKGPQDACGIFGVWAPGEEVAKLTFYGLYALQHRGQESAGIASSDGNGYLFTKIWGWFRRYLLKVIWFHLRVIWRSVTVGTRQRVQVRGSMLSQHFATQLSMERWH